MKPLSHPWSLVLLGVAIGAGAPSCKSAPKSGSAPERAATLPSAAPHEQLPAEVATPNVAAPAPASTPAPEPPPESSHCLSPSELEQYDHFGHRLQGPQRVVQVARSDTLALRESPSKDAPLVAKLSFDRADVMPTKKVCEVGQSDWYEVRVDGKTGWVNARFLARATTVHDGTARYRERAGGKLARTPSDLARAIVQTMNTPPPLEGRYRAELVDVVVSSQTASAIVYAFGELDDSVGGEQALVTMTKQEGGWSVERADVHYLCYRGPGQDPTRCT